MKRHHLRWTWRQARTRLPGLLALVTLGVFHVVMLFHRILDQSLLQRDVAGKWLLSVGLLGLAYYLNRRGMTLSLWRGPSGRVFWLLVLLLHVMVPLAEPAVPVMDLTPTESGLVLLPVTVGLAVLVAAAALRRGGFGSLRTPIALAPVRRRHDGPLYASPEPGRRRYVRPPPRF